MAQYLDKKRINKQCSKCGSWLPLTKFGFSGSGKRARISPRCKDCSSKYHHDRHAANRDRLNQAIKEHKYKRGYCYIWAMSVVGGHTSRGYTMGFSIDDLEKRAKTTPNCELCGRPLSWKFGHGKAQPDSPSLDNSNMKRVLFPRDVMIVCQSCNAAKGKRTLAQFLSFCQEQALCYELAASRYRSILVAQGKDAV